MAVKVRCPTCEKVLNAPDAARGKAVKCPDCDTKVKVPSGDSSAGGSSTTRRSGTKAPAKKRAEDDDEFLAGLDLDKVIDSSAQMCPKCGATIPDDATECPKCGVDPATGQLSASAKKRASRKGADPALFYSLAWKDSWAFTMENKSVALRTAMYSILVEVFVVLCLLLAGWLAAIPPMIFLAGLCMVAYLTLPGWNWYLTLEVIKTTVARKSDVRYVNFDIFQNIALGIKTIVWSIAFCNWLILPIVMYPLAMIHFAMPVTKKAWMMPVMVSIFFRNIAPTLYFWVIFFATNIVVFAASFVVTLVYYAATVTIISSMAKGQRPSGAAAWTMLAIELTIHVACLFAFSFTQLFNMRVIGLLAFYFKDTLDLVVLVADKTYVRKEVKVDKWGIPIESTGQKVFKVILVFVVLAVVAGVGYFVYLRLK